MSLTTPTTQDISENIIAQLEIQLNQTIPLLPKSFLRVLAKTLSGVFVLLYKYTGFMSLQLFISTASDQSTEINGKTVNPLTEWGRLVGVGDPTAATRAELLIDITVVSQVGSLPAGSQLSNASTGVTYITTSAVLLNAPTVSVTVRAASDQTGGGGVGAIGNVPDGTILTFVNPLPNVARDTVVTSQSVTGADAESTAAYRQRVLNRFRTPPQGGAYSDYRIWSNEVEGVLDSFPYTGDPGQVDIYVQSATEPDGIPTPAQLAAVLDSINLNESGLASRRPANAFPNSLPISRTLFDVEIEGLLVADLAGVTLQIDNALGEYFLSRAPFIVGLSVLPRFDRVTQGGASAVVDDVVNAAGGVFQRVIVRVGLSGISAYALAPGELAKLGTTDYT